MGISVLGLKASDLRNAGGVIDQARKSAFADSEGAHRIYPEPKLSTSVTDYEQLHFSIPLHTPLTSDEMAHDGVVIIDAYVSDISGNHNTISEIVFTGIH